MSMAIVTHLSLLTYYLLIDDIGMLDYITTTTTHIIATHTLAIVTDRCHMHF